MAFGDDFLDKLPTTEHLRACGARSAFCFTLRVLLQERPEGLHGNFYHESWPTTLRNHIPPWKAYETCAMTGLPPEILDGVYFD